MTRGVVWLQVASVALLTALIVYVGVVAKAERRPIDQGTPAATIDAERPERVLFANHGPCVFVLSSVDPGSGVARAARALPDVAGLVVLRTFHRGGDETLTMHPDRDRLALRVDATWTEPLRGVRAALRRPDLPAPNRTLLAAYGPTGPQRYTDRAIGRALYLVDRSIDWNRVEGARLLPADGGEIRFAVAALTRIELDTMLAGGPVPEALDPPPQRTSALPSDATPTK